MYSFFENLVSPYNLTYLKEKSSVLRFFLSQATGVKKYIFLIAIFSTLTAATEVYIFRFLGEVVDSMSNNSPANFLKDNLYELIKMTFVLLIILPLSAFLRTLFESQTLEVNYSLRVLFNLHGFAIKEGVEFFHREAAGKIANTISQTAFSSREIMIKVVNTFTFIAVFFLSMGALLGGIHLLLLIPVMIWILGCVFAVYYFFPKIRSCLVNQAYAGSEMAGKLIDTYTNIVTVKIFSSYDSELKYAGSYMAKFKQAAHQHMRVASSVQFVMWAINIILILGTILLSIWLWSRGAMTVGAIAAAVTVSLRLYTMTFWIMWELLDVSRNLGIVQNGMKLMSSTNSSPIPQLSWGDTASDVGMHHISFKNINFAYDGKRQVLKDFSLDVRKGEKLGVIGSSGSGKSTLAKLLLRLCESQYGDIFIQGKNIKQMSNEELLKKVSAVTQDVQMLHRSLRENLMYGSEYVNEERMIRAAEAAGAHEFICKIVDENGRKGYDAYVGVGGAKLSGGQKQRISLARAILKDAEIYILDEATSALDFQTEADVLNDLERYLDGKTVIMIAHRRETLSWVDRVVKIEDGTLKEGFIHDENLLVRTV